MRYFTYCLLILFTGSCTTGSYKNNEPSDPPSSELIRFCSEYIYISLNRDTDSTRLVKNNLYSELIAASMQRFDKQPFYPVSFENSQIIRFLKNESGKRALFEKTTGVWGFFYFRQDNGQFPDGVIEEWTFSSEEEAEDALHAIKNSGDQIFFNTQPYFCVIRNKLYVFHTRAMAFSYDQKPLFEAFVQRTGANR